MTLSFPSDPINGAVSGEYTYDATKGAWRKNAAYPTSVTHSDVAPSNPREGDQWWKSNEGTLFTYYNDGTSSQWVESTNVVASSDPNPIPAGAMMAWASDIVPANWLLCDGSAVSRSTYASLFASIGTTYGSGDGTTTFNLPNLKGRTIVGKDSTQTEFDTLGETGGAKTHTLTTSELPSHTHANTLSNATVASSAHRHEFKISMLDSGNYSPAGPNAGWGSGTGTAGAYRYSTGQWQGGLLNGSVSATGENYNAASARTLGRYDTTGDTSGPTETVTVGITNASAGSDGAHNNLQPYIVLNYIIKFSAGETPGDSQLAVRVGAVEAANNATPLSQNYIINGAFDIWQRGTSAAQAGNSNGFPSADRFRVYSVGASSPAITLARSTDVPSNVGVQYSAAMSWSSNISSGDIILHQGIENGKYLFAGKTVTVSFYAKAATAITSKLDFDQDYGETFFNLTTSWARYSYTITLPSTYATSRPSGAAANDNTELRFIRFTSISSTSNTIYFTGVQVEEGAYATPFRRSAPSLEAELASCQRYYYRHTADNNYGWIGTATGNGANAWLPIPFPVTMRAIPSSTPEWSGTLSNIGFLLGGTATSFVYAADGLSTRGGALTFSGSGFAASQLVRANGNSNLYFGFSAEI